MLPALMVCYLRALSLEVFEKDRLVSGCDGCCCGAPCRVSQCCWVINLGTWIVPRIDWRLAPLDRVVELGSKTLRLRDVSTVRL